MKAKIYESGTLINGVMVVEDLGMLLPLETSNKKQHYLIFQCPFCEKQFKTLLNSIVRAKTKSCGCYNISHCKELHTTHAMTKHPMYSSWANLKKRCVNPNDTRYIDYGGRGITICEEWLTFINFCNDMKDTWQEGLSIDRIENDKGYYKENCRWATDLQQAHNKRIQKSNTSGYVGVFFKKNHTVNKWGANAAYDGKRIHIGYFATALEAAIERDKYVKEHCLPNKLNFG